jgi:hypothetical protein
LQREFTNALHRVFQQRVLDAEKELASLGIETAA